MGSRCAKGGEIDADMALVSILSLKLTIDCRASDGADPTGDRLTRPWPNTGRTLAPGRGERQSPLPR